MLQKKTKDQLINIGFFAMLCVYLAAIVMINFSKNPNHYCTDMYSDMSYAVQVWEQKSIFPKGWVFGNQLYAVATPVVASVFYGIFQDPCFAMGAATVLMGVGVLFSFNWMLKPVFSDWQDRIVATVTFLALVLFFGNPVHAINGWQLFFTMCSYYACYAIAAFLAFGCYIRSNSQWSRGLMVILALTCALSFGTGLQSLRQTAVMICPLLAVQFLHMLRCGLRKEKLLDKSLMVTGLITISNLAGVVYSKIAEVEQVEIFGNIGIVDFSQIPSRILPGLSKIVSLMLPVENVLAVAVLLAGLLAGLYTVYVLKCAQNGKALTCLLLFGISIAGIFAIDVLLTMQVRNIYYFLLYPMIAVMVTALFSCEKRVLRYLIVFFLVVLFAFNCVFRLFPVFQQENSGECYEEVVHYLEDNGISTVYSAWNHGEKIGISSDWKIQVGFWDSQNTPFVGVGYLCDPAVFDAAPSKCAYLFFEEEEIAIAAEKAGEKNAEFTLAKHFPESGIYVFTSNRNLMNCE